MGATLTAYRDMIADQIEPDVETYHILVEGSLCNGSIKATRWIVYHIFCGGYLSKEVPRIIPNTELINKFIECCGVCQERERAFFFLGVLNDYCLVPSLELGDIQVAIAGYIAMNFV